MAVRGQVLDLGGAQRPLIVLFWPATPPPVVTESTSHANMRHLAAKKLDKSICRYRPLGKEDGSELAQAELPLAAPFSNWYFFRRASLPSLLAVMTWIEGTHGGVAERFKAHDSKS